MTTSTVKNNLVTFCSEFDLDEKVYFSLPDDDNKPGLVTGVLFRYGGDVSYEVTWSAKSCTWHHENELAREKPSSF